MLTKTGFGFCVLFQEDNLKWWQIKKEGWKHHSQGEKKAKHSVTPNEKRGTIAEHRQKHKLEHRRKKEREKLVT